MRNFWRKYGKTLSPFFVGSVIITASLINGVDAGLGIIVGILFITFGFINMWDRKDRF